MIEQENGEIAENEIPLTQRATPGRQPLTLGRQQSKSPDTNKPMRRSSRMSKAPEYLKDYVEKYIRCKINLCYEGKAMINACNILFRSVVYLFCTWIHNIIGL